MSDESRNVGAASMPGAADRTATGAGVGEAMRYGFVLPGGSAPEQVALAELAEEAGWDGVFVWEAAFGVDAWALLAAMAVRTRRIRLGTLLTPLPWRRPWKLASQLVTVDQLSGGRVVLSVGLGAVDDALGTTGEPTDRRERAALLDEGLDVVDALLAGDRRHQGTRYTLDLDRPDSFGPCEPVQRPRPPVWIVGLWGAERSMRRVARGEGYLPNVAGGPGGSMLEHVPAMRAWLDERGRSGGARLLDLVCEGQTPADDAVAAAELVAPYRSGGATWWVENRWGGDPHSVAGLAAVRERLEAGPPRG